MPRPRKFRTIKFFSNVRYYKPRGIPLKFLKEIILTNEEVEALRLKYILNFDQEVAAQKMGISQPTLHRTLNSAHRKIAVALIKGYAIRISD